MKKKLTRSQELVLKTLTEEDALTYEELAKNTGLSYDGVRGRVSELKKMGYNIDKMKEGINTFVLYKQSSSYKRPYDIKDSVSQKLKAVDDFYGITDLLDEIKKKKIKNKVFSYSTTTSQDRYGVLLLSDLHFGEIIYSQKENGVVVYDTEVASMHLTTLTNKVLEKLKKEKISTVYIIGLGDMVDGDMIYRNHLFRVEKPAIEQVQDAVREISKLIKTFVEAGISVEMYNVRGNHGITNYKNLEEDNWDNVVYDMLDIVFMDNEHVYIENFKSMEGAICVGNKTIVAYHGDKFGPQIKTASGLREFRGMCNKHKLEEGDMVVVGHLHEFGVEIDQGRILIRNGSLAETSDYAYRLNLFSEPMQTFMIVDENTSYPEIFPIEVN